MNLCKDCDIVFDEKNCPLCVAKDRISELEDGIQFLKEKLDNIEAA